MAPLGWVAAESVAMVAVEVGAGATAVVALASELEVASGALAAACSA